MKMKQFAKKITALAAAAAMTVGLAGLSVSAATSQPDTGTITVHKYARATEGSAHPDNAYSGEQLSAADEAALGTPLAGAGFTLYKLNMTTVNAAVQGGNTITGYTVSGTTVNFTLDGAGSPAVTTAAAAGTATGAEQVTPASGIVTFGSADLADGHYLLVETTTPAGYTAADPSVISLPLTLNDGSDANRDIHVYPKNIDQNAANVSKEVDGTFGPINTDDIIPFKITALFKNNATGTDKVSSVNDMKDGATYGSMEITDTLQSYFQFVDLATTPAGTKNFDVYLVNGAGVKIGASLISGTDYTLTGITPGTLGPAAAIKVVLTNGGIDKAMAANAAAVEIIFDAQYTGGAQGNGGDTVTTITNEANAVVKAPNGTTPPVNPPGKVTFPKAAVEVNKVDETNSAFGGAEFALCRVPVPTINYKVADWATYNAAQKTTLASEYVCDTNGQPITATSDAAGHLIFNSVPYTDAGATYYLKELSTQSGYELPASTIAVTLKSKATLVSEGSTLIDSSNKWTDGAVVKTVAKVVNNPTGTDKSFKLPLTGGAGTVLFTIIGILVMVTAAFFYIRSRKKA